jgi:hypothetical protein
MDNPFLIVLTVRQTEICYVSFDFIATNNSESIPYTSSDGDH